ncbi:MAG TPA: hypothetical protein VHE59_10455 [Mucilaginibacter sp.]|nr:hypothetical protein [Mucilaginibacter sp.]
METKLEISKVKAQLPHGAQTEIAKRASVTKNTVHLVLTGKSDNIVVLEAIADYLAELQAKKQATTERLSKLVG